MSMKMAKSRAAKGRVRKYLIALTLLLVIAPGFWLSSGGVALADDWVKGYNTGQRTWVDTSKWEPRTRWIDTSYWETRWGWTWVSSGYWAWISSGHNDFYYATMTCWPPYWGMPGYSITWWQEAWYNCWDWGWGPMRFGYSWGYHTHRSDVYCPGAGWASAWWSWHDKSYWTWIDTSYWAWAPQSVWVASGYWQTYQEWVASGYWADPLHGTITVAKSQPYVFTRWHYMTSDGRWQNQGDERAHLDLTASFATNKPIKSYRVYANINRHDIDESHYSLTLASGSISDPQPAGSIIARGEYEFGGLGTHYVQITAVDGSTATVSFDIPINSFRGINTNETGAAAPGQPFTRSVQDTGTISF
jgi:hypothetical protein